MNRMPDDIAGAWPRRGGMRRGRLFAPACALVAWTGLFFALPALDGTAVAQAEGPALVAAAGDGSTPPEASGKKARQQGGHGGGPDREALRVRYLDLLLAYERIKDPARKRKAYRYLLRLYEQLTGERP